MKRILDLLIVLSAGMAWADWMYDPNNPNPTQHDVWAAEQNAQSHMQRSVEVSGWDSIEEQRKANQARQDADQMRMRMWENERIENERRERVRREEEELYWQQRQESDDMLVVPGASASMLKHMNKKRAQRQVNFNGNGWGRQDDDDEDDQGDEDEDDANVNVGVTRFSRSSANILRQQANSQRQQWIRRAESSLQYNKEYLEKQRNDAYYEKWKQKNAAARERAEAKRVQEDAEKNCVVRKPPKKKGSCKFLVEMPLA